MAFEEIAKWNHFIFLQNESLPGFLLNSFCLTAGFQRSSYCVKPVEIRLAFFYVIHFVDTQFRENISVFPWHQNYAFWKGPEMKSFYFSPKWRSSGLPIDFSLSNCGLPTVFLLCEARGSPSRIFLCNSFCRYSVSRKSECVSLAPKLWLLQRSRNEIILFLSKMKVFLASYRILLCNCGLPTVFLLCEAHGNPSGIFFISYIL